MKYFCRGIFKLSKKYLPRRNLVIHGKLGLNADLSNIFSRWENCQLLPLTWCRAETLVPEPSAFEVTNVSRYGLFIPGSKI